MEDALEIAGVKSVAPIELDSEVDNVSVGWLAVVVWTTSEVDELVTSCKVEAIISEVHVEPAITVEEFELADETTNAGCSTS
jgi:hypothetical protein